MGVVFLCCLLPGHPRITISVMLTNELDMDQREFIYLFNGTDKRGIIMDYQR